MDGPKLSVTFEPATTAPGQPLKVNVVASHASAVVGGVFVDTLGKGELKLIEGTQTRLIGAGQGTHSEPHPYVGGQVKFTFDWIAPSEVGATRFVVWSNATNDNEMPADDSPARATAYVTHGCAGVWSYPDLDSDGFGDQVSGELACAPVQGLLSQGGDCDDSKPTVHTGAVEACNSIDDDCDGEMDEGFSPARHYVDADADGFGALGSTTIMGCSPIAGYAPKTGDCDDARPEINPFAAETPNGIDDNCDSKIDEMPSMATGGSGGSPPTTGGAALAPPSAGPPSADGGCNLNGGDTGKRRWSWAWVALACAALALRRSGSRALFLQ